MRSRKGTKLRQAEKGFPQGFIILSLKTHSVGHANDDDDDGKRSLGHGMMMVQPLLIQIMMTAIYKAHRP